MFLFYPYTVRRMAAHGTTYRLQHFVTIQPEQWKVPHFCEVEYSAVDQRYAGNHFYRKTAFAQISPLIKAGALPSVAGSFYDATENHVLSIKWQRASLAKMEEYILWSQVSETKSRRRSSAPVTPCRKSLTSCTMSMGRSEERREGKECRSRWSPYH